MYILGSTGIVGLPVTSDVADVTWDAVSRVDDLLFAAATDVGRIPLEVAREEVEQLVRLLLVVLRTPLMLAWACASLARCWTWSCPSRWSAPRLARKDPMPIVQGTSKTASLALHSARLASGLACSMLNCSTI